MKRPETPAEIKDLHDLLVSDPGRYMQSVDDWVCESPCDAIAYFNRHLGWMHIGQPRRAIQDISRVIELDPKSVAFLSRGDIYRHLGEYELALADYGRGEAIDPVDWEQDAIGLLQQADCHARLGDEHSALAYCARLPEDFWTPGIDGAPAGGKADIAEMLRRIATHGRYRRS